MTRDTEAQQNEVFAALVKNHGAQEYWMWDVLSHDVMNVVVGRWWAAQ